jgi:hypothetical protein
MVIIFFLILKSVLESGLPKLSLHFILVSLLS